MKVGFFGRNFSDTYAAPVQRLIELMSNDGNEIRFLSSFYDFLLENIDDCPKDAILFDDHKSCKDLDLLISIGGDGTMLSTLHYVQDSNVPVLGINTGRLGFLSNVSSDDIDETVEAIKAGNYETETRSLLKVSVNGEELEFRYALNEVTIHKKDSSSMITIDTWMDDTFISTYWADGLILSTPTGSTAYSLSCGGPIVMPSSRNVILTPIAPHNLNVRPLVLSNDHVITMKPKGRDLDFLLTLDSKSYSFSGDVRVSVKKAEFELNLVQIEKNDYFNTIRRKLNWGMDKRNFG